MEKLELDTSAFARAIDRFAEGLEALRKQPDNDLIRDGVIQRFEFTYELSHKMLKRYLEMAAASPAAIDDMNFADMIRTGNEQGLLLSDWPAWKGYRQLRTDTSHTYNEDKALKVIEKLPVFLDEAKFLLAQLQRRTSPP